MKKAQLLCHFPFSQWCSCLAEFNGDVLVGVPSCQSNSRGPLDPSNHGGERLISVVTGSPVVDELALRKTFLTEQQYVALKMWSFIWMSFLLSRIIVHDFDGAVKELGWRVYLLLWFLVFSVRPVLLSNLFWNTFTGYLYLCGWPLCSSVMQQQQRSLWHTASHSLYVSRPYQLS